MPYMVAYWEGEAPEFQTLDDKQEAFALAFRLSLDGKGPIEIEDLLDGVSWDESQVRQAFGFSASRAMGTTT